MWRLLRSPFRKRNWRKCCGAPTTAAAVLLALGCMVGCGKRYLLVDVTYDGTANLNQKRDVRATSNYKEHASTLKSMAFRLPDRCLTNTAAQATGTTGKSDVVLLSECAVWLSRLERAVTEAGYRVISYDALNRLERQKQISPYAAARELGADLVFMINSLETGEKKFGGQAGLKLHYFSTNQYGQAGEEEKLDAEMRKLLKSFVKDSLNQDPEFTKERVSSLSATLDATGVLSSSGEAIWFYRWGVGKKLHAERSLSYLFRGRGDFWRPVEPWQPKRLKATPKMERDAEEEIVESHDREAKVDPYQAQKFELVETVASDFVKNFQAGSR